MQRRNRAALVLILVALVGPGSCGSGAEQRSAGGAAAGTEATAQGAQAPAPGTPTREEGEAMDERPTAVLVVKDRGEIHVELFPDKAPKTVENFLKLARDDFYDGTTFHRVIPGFMIQGGDPLSKDDDPSNDGTGGPGYTIPAEFNDTKHERGVLSMARKADPDSAGSQFFIVHEAATHLDGQYTAFGRVTEGMEVVDAIVRVERDARDRPLRDVVVEEIRVEGGGAGEAGGA